jgi:hypothetical protein
VEDEEEDVEGRAPATDKKGKAVPAGASTCGDLGGVAGLAGTPSLANMAVDLLLFVVTSGRLV